MTSRECGKLLNLTDNPGRAIKTMHTLLFEKPAMPRAGDGSAGEHEKGSVSEGSAHSSVSVGPLTWSLHRNRVLILQRALHPDGGRVLRGKLCLCRHLLIQLASHNDVHSGFCLEGETGSGVSPCCVPYGAGSRMSQLLETQLTL